MMAARTDDTEARADGRSHGSDIWLMTPRLGCMDDAKAMEDDATARKEAGVYRRFSYFGRKWLRLFSISYFGHSNMILVSFH